MAEKKAVSSGIADTGRAIASLLIEEGHITPEQLNYAYKVLSKLATPQTLLHILQELRFVNDEQLRSTLRKHPVAVRLGDLLVELGYLRYTDLEAALTMQQMATEKKRLGEILVEGYFLTESQLVEVLSYQLGFPYIEVNPNDLDRTLLQRVNQKWLAEHQCVPVKLQDGKVLVALSDPLNQTARGAAEQMFGTNLEIGITTHSAVQDVLHHLARDVTARITLPNEDTVVGMVNALFEEALEQQASDIHIEPMKDRLRVRFRCDGVLIPHKDFRKDLAPAITSRIKVLAQADIAEKRRHQDGRLLYEGSQGNAPVDMRASFYVTVYGEKIVLRLLSRRTELLSLNEIGMAPRMLERFRCDALEIPSGVVLITGPTGSGKTTTLYSCVAELNAVDTSIITAEDPVEYLIDGISQCSINAKLNLTFAETLRHIVRQDPDIIVLGEIRDKFSAETAIQAALTGHKVLTTFHTEDSIGGLLRLLNMDIEAFLISSTVVCVVAQRLLRKICSSCAESYTPTPTEMQRLGYTSADIQGIESRRGRGCQQCRFTGYKGRIGAYELLVLDERVKEALLARQTSYEIRRISLESSGLVTLLEDGIVKAARGLTSFKEVLVNLPRLSKPRPLRELRRLLGE